MFERYTEKARRVIFFARYEASTFGSASIEPEFLLLGLFRESRNIFHSLIPELDHVSDFRDRVSAMHAAGGSPIATSVDLPLADEAKRILFYAAEEAQRLAHSFIGSEHLLLGVLRAQGPAAAFLGERGMTADFLREQLAREGVSASVAPLVPNSPAGAPRPGGTLALSGASVHLIAYALEEAEKLGHKRIEPQHLLLAMMKHEASPIAHYLHKAGADSKTLRDLLVNSAALRTDKQLD